MIPEIRKGTVETFLAGAIILWVAALPLPFGGNTPSAFPLVAHVPLFLCFLAAVLRHRAEKDRVDAPHVEPPAYRIATTGFGAFLAIVAIQLVPLPLPVLSLASPRAAAIWTSASSTLELAGLETRSWFPLSLDPSATLRELVRLAGVFAAFQAAAMMMRSHRRRVALVAAIAGSALFQVAYAVHEAALGRFAIWGWKNTRIFGRMTGTFVNPNHFAHYLAIAVPLIAFIAAIYWHDAAPRRAGARRRLASLLESHFLLVGGLAFSAAACVAGILLAQSRGALLALVCGGMLATGLVMGRRGTPSKTRTVAAGLLVLVAATLSIGAFVTFLGEERTVARFRPSDEHVSNFVGRKTGLEVAARLWTSFPLFGTGAGTFREVVSLEQREDQQYVYNHTHNDYAETAATTGTLGALVAIVTLSGSIVALWRGTFGAAAHELRWRRRAFHVAAMAMLFVAMTHALLDFNFFIPANVLTLAVVTGAAVSPLSHDTRTRR